MILYIKRVHMQKSYERLERLWNLERFTLDSEHWVPLQTCPRVCRIPRIQKRYAKWRWMQCDEWRGILGRCRLLRSSVYVQRNESNNRFGLLETCPSVKQGSRKSIYKLAQDRLILCLFYGMIIICSILIQLSIQHFLMLSCVQQHHMRTPLKKP